MPRPVHEIQQAQGWTDETMFTLFNDFLEQHGESLETKWREFLEDRAREENDSV